MNDEKFCELWIKDRINIKPIGRKRIYYELKQKGIDPELIQFVLNKCFSEEIEYILAMKLVNKKIKLTKELNKEKIKGFLYQKGFSISIINKVINEIFIS